jgi:peptidoglycan/LPS O-acetylase OafA/YrhL
MRRIDGLRGILAMYVLLGHALPFTVFPWWLQAMFRHGEAAVDLFFAISGLVVVQSLERFGGNFRLFLWARGRRLLPVYFIVLAGSLVALAAGNPLPAMPWLGVAAKGFWDGAPPPDFLWHLAAHVFLVNGLIPQGALPFAYITLLGPAWSLSTEWQFYVVMGLLFAPRRLVAMALGLLAAGAVYRLLPLPEWWGFSRAFLPDAAPYFALGVASAAWRRGAGAWVFFLCLAGACAIGLTGGMAKAVVPLLWAVAMLAQQGEAGRVLESRILLWLGAVSYPLYLVNEPVQRALALVIAPRVENAVMFSAIFLPLAVMMPLATAVLLHHGVEERFLRKTRRISKEPIAPRVSG